MATGMTCRVEIGTEKHPDGKKIIKRCGQEMIVIGGPSRILEKDEAFKDGRVKEPGWYKETRCLIHGSVYNPTGDPALSAEDRRANAAARREKRMQEAQAKAR